MVNLIAFSETSLNLLFENICIEGLRVTSIEIYNFEYEKYGGMSQKRILG